MTDKSKQWSKPPEMALDLKKSYSAILHTDKGDITVGFLQIRRPERSIISSSWLARDITMARYSTE